MLRKWLNLVANIFNAASLFYPLLSPLLSLSLLCKHWHEADYVGFKRKMKFPTTDIFIILELYRRWKKTPSSKQRTTIDAWIRNEWVYWWEEKRKFLYEEKKTHGIHIDIKLTLFFRPLCIILHKSFIYIAHSCRSHKIYSLCNTVAINYHLARKWLEKGSRQCG